MLYAVSFRWTEVTGGENGLGGITRPTLFGLNLESSTNYYWFVASIAFLVLILLLVFTRDIAGYHVIAALMILLREIIVSGLREFLATLQVSMPVTQLAKWKTTFQLVAFGALILAGALPGMQWIKTVGLVSLWGAAVLTLITGWDYLRVGLKHMD